MRLTILTTGLLLLAVAAARADEAPLYQQEPYDTITLDEANKNAELKVRPLDLPDRLVPAKPNAADELEIRLLDRPRKAYKVAWGNIAKVVLFEQRVLDEAERLVEATKLDEAYPYYDFLQRRYPKMIPLAESYNKYLMAGATEAYKGAKYEECLALSWELYNRDPENKRAVNAIRAASDKLIAGRFADGDYAAARLLLHAATERLKDGVEPLGTTWNEKLHAKAVALAAEAKEKIAAKHFSEASVAARQALAAWPEIEGGKELAATIQMQYPEVVVGVTALSDPLAAPTDSWEARRDGRLLARSLVEVVTSGVAGNTYSFPLAKMNRANGDHRIELTVNPAVHWSDGRRLTGADLARALSPLSDAGDSLARRQWHELVTGLRSSNSNEVDLDLKQPVAHFEPWLETPVWPATTSSKGNPAASLGPYRTASSDGKETRFDAVADYFAAGAKQPRQIVERLLPDVAAAVLALRRGEISAVDRLDPWTAAALADSKPVTVEPYGITTLHVLVPNVRRPLLNNPTLRRALAHAVDRSGILLDRLSRGKLPPGCEPTDSLVNKAAAGGAIELRFDSSAAKLLVDYSLAQSAANAQTRDAAAAISAGFVLAHPRDEVARQACQAMAEQLKAVGLPVRLKEYAASDLANGSLDADLIYVEWTPLEPLAELPRLFGSQGWGGDAGPLVERLLREVQTAGADQAADRLGRLEDSIRQQTLAIPLWRLNNYVAYRHELTGVGQRPVTLYQNVEQWNLTPAGADE